MPTQFIIENGILFLLMWTVIFFRYVLIAGFFYFFFFKIKAQAFKSKRISTKLRKAKQTKKEILNSFISSGLFAIGGVFLIEVWKNDYALIYNDVSQYGILYLFLSTAIFLFVHDTYYYWLHRWMHRPGVYKYLHRMHHDSIATSPWTSFSFDLSETLLQAIFVPIMIFVLPMHFGVILLLLTIMTLSATINHLDIEIYPKNFNKHPIGKWLIGATHHSLHHSEFVTNYGLYFTFWDHWMGTESKVFDQRFEEVTAQEVFEKKFRV